MSAKHTPGQWTPEFGEAYNVRAPHGGIVAQIHNLKGRHGMGGRIDGNEAAANARLIAAAPDLLDALKHIYYSNEFGFLQDGIQNHARAAIAKATGEPA